MSITLTQTEIPLAKLVVHPENVRAKTSDTEPESDITGLAQSIKAIGLINPLTVQKLDGGKWGVLAGKRRLAARGLRLRCRLVPRIISGEPAPGRTMKRCNARRRRVALK